MRFSSSILLFFTTFAMTVFCKPMVSDGVLSKRLSIPHETYTLPNGLDVILALDKSTPFVASSIWYQLGSIFEQRKRTGLAHLFEHLMFEGTTHIKPPLSHFGILEGVGASALNASTSFDRTNYYQTVPKTQLETVLSLESSRMTFLTIDKEKLDEQRAVVKREREQRYETTPYAMAKLELWQNLFPKKHPLHGNVIGSHEDLNAASVEDVQNFYDKFYGPSNACLTLVGDFDTTLTKKLIQKYFATLPASPKQLPPQMPQVTLTEQSILRVEEKLGRLPFIRMHYITPALFKDGDAEADILSHVLSGGENGRLVKALTRDANIATSAVAYQQSMEQISIFTIDALLNPGVDEKTAISKIDEVLSALVTNPPSEKEIEQAKNSLLSDLFFGLQNLGGNNGRAELLQSYHRYAKDSNFIEKDLARYQKITQQNLLETAKKHLPAGTARKVLVAMPAQKKLAKRIK